MNAPAAAVAAEAIVARLEQGDATAAERLARQACGQFPANATLLRLHGVALLTLGRGPEARATLERALRIAPDDPAIVANLASAALATGDAAQAVALLRRAVKTQPGNAALHNNLGNALRAAGDDSAARDAYAAALAVAPDYVNASLNLAATEIALGESAAAQARLRALLTRQPHPQAWLLLGHALYRERHDAEAEAAYLQAARLTPASAEPVYQAGLMADEQRHYADAIERYRRALQLDPALVIAEGQLLFALRREYVWTAAKLLGARVKARALDGSGTVDPFAFLAEDATAADQLACASARAATIGREVAPLRQRLAFTHAPHAAGAPLRVGFVSAGFGNHPTALLTAELFEYLGQRDDLEIHLYATTTDDGSPLRARLRRAIHACHEVAALPSTAIAQQIHATRIDVLVDVDGWCAGARPEIFALRPAPVQVNWLAYPGTSGAPWMDWLIADRFVIPEAAQRFYSEKIAYLPGCYQPSDTTRALGPAPDRAACGLPEGAVVFASFNLSWKLNAASFARMCRVLREVPGSVLWLLAASPAADARLRDAARAHGIDPTRLVFAPKLPPAGHLDRLQRADLFLDTHPYNAHTTASDALWAGCPVLTCPGQTFASRVAGSLNHFLGLPELNAKNDDDFVAIAARLGNDPGALVHTRSRLAEQRRSSGVFKTRLYAPGFATLLRHLAGYDTPRQAR
ncbi:MAG TPA: tetratricopeptide repeat protein [Rhodanobacteraceae bacterium]|nr:tetratricopeptide repeat protein [Rhodanobacteraceae bacterium]